MGADGGSIPMRCELVKEKKKPPKTDPNEINLANWNNCSYSKKPLKQPVVSCKLGRLYNKIDILEALLASKTSPTESEVLNNPFPSHIKSLKDLVTLKLMENPAAASNSASVPLFICPVTMREMCGKYKFVYLSSCGCVFSESVLSKVNSNSCILCDKPFKNSHVIFIDPYSKVTAEEDVSSSKGDLISSAKRIKKS